MRAFLFVAVVAVLLFAASASKNYNLKKNAKDLFDEYLADNQLSYKGSEYASRFVTFKANVKEVLKQQRDASNKGVQLNLAGNAHLTDAEFKAQRLGSKAPTATEGRPDKSNKRSAEMEEFFSVKRDLQTLPSSINWKSKGKVTSVKNQGKCGDCWAFASTAVMESMHAIKGHGLANGSPQHVLDCTPVSHGCSGGWQGEAYKYSQKNVGIELWANYPYKAYKGTCHNPPGGKIGAVTGWNVFPQHAYSQIMNWVGLRGPVGVLIDATYWRYYSGGVITKGSRSASSPNHSVVVVGYGKTSSGVPVWIIKNSWGTGWGMSGYAFVKRSSSASYNYCGVTNWAHYVTVA
jgi:C1A family cysteine protease